MRTREIAPGFFRNEQLGTLEPVYRILFIGLWCCADREGRLEDRPLKLAAEILPYDQIKGEAGVQKLADAGLIQRYQIGDQKFIQIVNFLKYQHPHHREIASKIPPRTSPGKAQGKPQASPRLAQDKPRESRAALSSLSSLSTTPLISPLPQSGAEPGLFEISCLKGLTYLLTQSEVDRLSEAYPTVDVPGEVRKAIAWLEANPQRRKTVRGMPRFLVGWMNRAQNGNGKAMAPARKAPMSPSEALAALHAAIESGDLLRIIDAAGKCNDWSKTDPTFRDWPGMIRAICEAQDFVAEHDP